MIFFIQQIESLINEISDYLLPPAGLADPPPLEPPLLPELLDGVLTDPDRGAGDDIEGLLFLEGVLIVPEFLEGVTVPCWPCLVPVETFPLFRVAPDMFGFERLGWLVTVPGLLKFVFCTEAGALSAGVLEEATPEVEPNDSLPTARLEAVAGVLPEALFPAGALLRIPGALLRATTPPPEEVPRGFLFGLL